jgi:hypothetical protein
VSPARFRPGPRSSSRSSSSRSSNAALVAAVVGLAALVAPADARAIERQHHLGLGPALGILSIEGKSTASVGGGGALHYAYGLTDQWNLTLGLSSAVVAANQRQDRLSSPHDRPATVDNAAAGAAYVIDILRWVPYLGVEAGAYRLAGGTMSHALLLPGASAGAGLDYQLSRDFAVGVSGRQHFLLGKLTTYPSYTTVVVRFEYMWGY